MNNEQIEILTKINDRFDRIERIARIDRIEKPHKEYVEALERENALLRKCVMPARRVAWLAVNYCEFLAPSVESILKMVREDVPWKSTEEFNKFVEAVNSAQAAVERTKPC